MLRDHKQLETDDFCFTQDQRSGRGRGRALRHLLAAAAAGAGFFAVGSAWAVTYQVGPGRAHTDLASVAPLLQAGDVVEVDGGHSYEGGVAFTNPGKPQAPITIRGVAASGKRPVIEGGQSTIEAAADHYVFENLELTGGALRCFFHRAHDITLRGSVVRDCPQHGILGADNDSGSMLLEYTEIYGTGDGTQKHQVYMATDEIAHPGSVFRMQHCYVHDANGGNNVKSRAERNEIYYNWIEGAQYHEIELIGPVGPDPELVREDSEVMGNVIYKRNNNWAVRFGGDGTAETNANYRFINNTVVLMPSGKPVFRLFEGLNSVDIRNNVFATMGAGTVDMIDDSEAHWASGQALITAQSNWVQDGAQNLLGNWSGTLGGTDPGFASLDGMDLRPAATSPLRNAGTAVQSGPQYEPPMRRLQAPGSAARRASRDAMDVGAFELAPQPSRTPPSGGGNKANGSGNGAGAGPQGKLGHTRT